jgi:hypothetical protein
MYLLVYNFANNKMKPGVDPRIFEGNLRINKLYNIQLIYPSMANAAMLRYLPSHRMIVAGLNW